MSKADITAKWQFLCERIDERNRQRLRDAKATGRVLKILLSREQRRKRREDIRCDRPAEEM